MNNLAGWIVAGTAIGFIVGFIVCALGAASMDKKQVAQIEDQAMTIDDLKEQLRAIRDPNIRIPTGPPAWLDRSGFGGIALLQTPGRASERSEPGPEAA